MSQLNRTHSRLACRSAIFVLALWVGCGESGPPLYPVQGQVVYKDDGSPFRGATAVVFESRDPPYTRASSELDSDGKFVLATERRAGTGAMEGKHRVSISYITSAGAYVQETLAKQIDKKYFEFSTSGLEVDIKPNQPNEIKIELARPGK